MQLTGLDYDAANKLLEEADRSVKLALVMQHNECGLEDGKKILENADGFLNRVLKNEEEKHLYNKINSEELKLALANEPFERITASFYKYVDISVPNELRDKLYEVWNQMGVFGRVYIADEGINAQVSIPQPNWEIFKKSVLSNDLFRGIIIKKAIQEGSSFYKLKIKVRKELVAYDVPKESFDMRKVGKHLTASDYNLAIESKDSTVVDMRNYYESEIGRFENAIIPDVETSKELLPEVKNLLKVRRMKKYYCIAPEEFVVRKQVPT